MYTPFPGSSSIAHLYARCPALIIATVLAGVLIANPSIFSTGDACENVSIITFTFDDGYRSQFRYAEPILDKYGYDGVEFMAIKDIAEEPSEYMTYGDLSYLAGKGWEIGSHSVGHEHLTEISLSDARKSIVESKKILFKNGFLAETFATPYGEYNDDIIRIIKSNYKAHRTVDIGLNNIPLVGDERYLLKSIVVYDDTTFEDVKYWMDRAKDEHKWLILTFHRIGESGHYNTDIDTFERIVKYAYDNGFVNYI